MEILREEIFIVQHVNGKFRESITDNYQFFENLAEIEMHKNYINFPKYGFNNYEEFATSFVYFSVEKALNETLTREDFYPEENRIVASLFSKYYEEHFFEIFPEIILPNIDDITLEENNENNS